MRVERKVYPAGGRFLAARSCRPSIALMLRPVAPLLLCLLVSSSAHAVETMRIAMSEPGDSVEIRAEGLLFGQDAEDTLFRDVRTGRVVVTRVKGRLQIDGAPFIGEAVRFRAREPSVDAGVRARPSIHAGKHEVRGDVVVRLHRSGLQLINVVPLEDYLAAVLGSEMPASFPSEALKAQAVAARTYALHKKLAAYGQPFHLGSSVLHQVYGGVNREDPRTLEAVQATRGQVLTFELSPIEAYFHASCGGHTASGREALSRDLPYLKSVKCGCDQVRASRWSLELSSAEIEKVLGPIESLGISGRTESGRAQRVSLGRGRSVDAVSFRARLGYTKVKSLDFEVKGTRTFKFEGRGYGHGAGLCQWGAKVSADAGWEYRRILSHYYPGTDLQQLY